jgi:hypothetical protein
MGNDWYVYPLRANVAKWLECEDRGVLESRRIHAGADHHLTLQAHLVLDVAESLISKGHDKIWNGLLCLGAKTAIAMRRPGL